MFGKVFGIGEGGVMGGFGFSFWGESFLVGVGMGSEHSRSGVGTNGVDPSGMNFGGNNGNRAWPCSSALWMINGHT